MNLKLKDILVLSPTPTYPLDQGNRRRIYAYCMFLKERGARIHFVYYPFEWWFKLELKNHIEEMKRQWDYFYLLPVSQPVQPPPKNGNYHHIDEWWDATAIEPMLKWLFERNLYDAFIVNYIYLSKAFEFAPRETLKILDTHDKFSGRRELLESIGAKPEFFYTTPEMEKIALDKADVIWAIQDEEAEFFKTLTKKPVIVLPHIEPMRKVERTNLKEDEDYIVLGFAGVANSINIRAIISFFDEVLPVIRNSLAPVKIRLGGSICDYFKDKEIPLGVELAGTFDKPEDFYSKIDAVLLPIKFSTGLKIKAIEAFSFHLPVIAYKNSVEGIPTDYPYHKCETPLEMANHIIELAFSPDKLERYKRDSAKVYSTLQKKVEKAYENIFKLFTKRKRILIIGTKELLIRNSFYFLHLLETFWYLKALYPVDLYVDDLMESEYYEILRTLSRFWVPVRIFISPTTYEKWKRTLSHFPTYFDITTIEEYCKSYNAFLFLYELTDDVEKNLHNFTDCFLRIDVIKSLGKINEEKIKNFLVNNPKVSIVSILPPDLEEFSNLGNPYLQIPYFKNENIWPLSEMSISGFWILTTSEDIPLRVAGVLWELIKSLYPEDGIKLILPDEKDIEVALENNHLPRRARWDIINYRRILMDVSKINTLPHTVIDLSPDLETYSMLHDALIRRGINWYSVYRKPWIVPDNANTLEELLQKISRAKEVDLIENKKIVWRAYMNDARWIHLWKKIQSKGVWR